MHYSVMPKSLDSETKIAVFCVIQKECLERLSLDEDPGIACEVLRRGVSN